MPKRTDLERILVLGAGPIVIGQACEFDYSGTQACKALRDDGYQVVLLNSNPATIMTDPELADRTYIEPITLPVLEQILARERPDAVLTTLGGQTALNLAVSAAEAGLFERYGVEMLGADLATIQRAENRQQFRDLMRSIGLQVPPAAIAHSLEEAEAQVQEMGLPAVIRPSYTLGGTGGGIAHTPEQFREITTRGLELSLNTEVLVEKSVFGWKEFELELMRDGRDNVVVICSIENVDAMGVHTGDSITVAPAQTLTDREYQQMRDAAIKVIRAVGVETGGSNIQFAVNPADGRLLVIEMNPRLSRSSALASKATGFPIAKFAAKLAVGWGLDEIPNDITKQTPACFEPTIDYCVVKIPRFAFEKFPGVDATLTTQMQSVGEVLALGRTFKEALQKGLRGLETDADGFSWPRADGVAPESIVAGLRRPSADRLFFIRLALERGMTVDEVAAHTHVDPWFVDNMAQILTLEGAPQGGTEPRGGAERECRAARQARRFLRPPVGRAGRLRRTHAARTAAGAGGASHLQAGGHLRRGVRGVHPVLLLHLRDGGRGDGGAGAQGDDRRRRPQPHRPGHRVRLLLLSGVVRPARVGLPVDHGQLQSRDRVHRLRHLRPPVLRAAHGGGRGQHLRQGAAGRGDPPVRRPDPAQHGARAGGAGGEGAGHPHRRH